jgi:hypothetical protein
MEKGCSRLSSDLEIGTSHSLASRPPYYAILDEAQAHELEALLRTEGYQGAQAMAVTTFERGVQAGLQQAETTFEKGVQAGLQQAETTFEKRLQAGLQQGQRTMLR